MAKDRGIEKIEEITGDFLKIISKTIAKKGKVKILEAGCGYGVAMMGFVKRFGEKIEIIGFNLNREHGAIDRMKKQAVEKEIFTKAELKKIKNLPKIIYCDASKKLPFNSDTFDFIYSRAAVYLFDDKVKFFEECNRILKKGGIARIAPGFNSLPAPEGNKDEPYGIEIWDKGIKVKPEKYFNKIREVKFVTKPKKTHYLEILKTKNLDFGLKLIASIDYNFVWHEWMGVKSIYTTQINFKPHWKS
jgi:SAM-dependent methyltransferase